jgi:two-component system, sensor histidine kinase and response regulator
MNESAGATRPLVLVIDDSAENRLLIKATLRTGGFDVMQAENGEVGLRLLDTLLPDVVLLDVYMPGIDGFEVCRRMRAQARTRRLPVILMSALSDREAVANAFAAGGVDFLAKPFRGEELCARTTVHAELARARRELEESHARLAQLNAEKDQMFGMAAHDLRGPLATIVGFAEHALSVSSAEGGTARQALEVIQREAQQMNHYLVRLLDLNAVERGGMTLESRVLDLREIAIEAITRHGPLGARKRLILRPPGPGPRGLVRADAAALRQVVDNYLSNAIKFTPPGGEVTLEVRGRDHEVHLTVTDTGPGLSAQDLEKVFSRFARLSARPTGGEKSTGLGLAICRALTERMGGRVWCGNQPLGGACFGLSLAASTSLRRDARDSRTASPTATPAAVAAAA